MGKNKNKNNTAKTNTTNTNVTSLTTTATEKTKTETKAGTSTGTKTGNTTSLYGYRSCKKNYDYKGAKNKTDYPEFVNICKLDQTELKTLLPEMLIQRGYCDLVTGDGYIYAKGEIPVLLTAHMDTVHDEKIKDFYEYYDKGKNQHILSSPQGIGGDDRCGIYMILEIIKTHKCSVLFCEDEESGGIGSNKFCKTDLIKELSSLNYLIELDRANGDDAVFYECDNEDFTDFIVNNTGYIESYGSFSDISNLSPECKVASVNLSCGYYNAHTTSEYVIVEEMLNTIETVRKLLDVESEPFEYIERYNYFRTGYYGSYYGGYGRYNYDDYYDDFNYGGCYSGSSKSSNKAKMQSLLVHIYDEITDEVMTYVANGTSYEEAFGKFFMKNPKYCFDDVFDYESYDFRTYEEGWYTGLYY